MTVPASVGRASASGLMHRWLRPSVRFVRFGWQQLLAAIHVSACALPYFRFVRETREAPNPRTFAMWFMQKVVGFNRGAYWPVHFTSRVNQWQNVLVGIDTAPGYEGGCYIQGLGRVYIGDYTAIAKNVGIISANHDPYDPFAHDTSKVVRIGSYCWLGMGAIILPGVELGDFTVVAAGAIVTKSFPDGYAVIAGNPAKVIRRLEPEGCVRRRLTHEYRGYIRAERFEEWKKFRVWA